MVGRLIRDRRVARGWSQEDLADVLGTSQRQVTRWEGYTTQLPRGFLRERLGEALVIAPAEWHLAAATAAASSTSEMLPRRLTDDELLDKIGARPYDPIELIEGVFGSAGPGVGIPQDIDDTLPRRRRKKRYDRLKEITVIGRCMEPELYPGDLVILDRDLAPVSGKIVVAVRDEEELLIKRFMERDGVQCLVSNKGQEVAVDERVRILGPAVAFQRGLW